MISNSTVEREVQTTRVEFNNKARKAEMYSAGYKTALVHGAAVAASVLMIAGYFF